MKNCIKQIHLGFTLVELSVVLVIIGLIMGGAIGLQQSSLEKDRKALTDRRLQVILDAIDAYVDYYGYLPCPSNPSANFDSTNFGRGRDDTTGGANPTISTVTANNCLTNNPNVTNVVTGNLVIGGVPVLTLGLHPSYANDGYSNRFTYVVDQDLTFRGDISQADDATGAVTAGTLLGYRQDNGDKVYDAGTDAKGDIKITKVGRGTVLRDDVAALVISHGADGSGAWPGRGGAQNGTAGATAEELENTDADDIFIQPFASPNSDDVAGYLTKWQIDYARP